MVVKIIGAMRYFLLEDTNIFSIGEIDISSDHSYREEYFMDKDFLAQFGLISKTTFNNEWCYAVSIFPENLQEQSPPVSDYNKALARNVDTFIKIMHSLQSFLWFAKDNCCMSSDIFGQGIDKHIHVFTNRMSIGRYSNSLGEFEDASFTVEQLNKTLALIDKFNLICPEREDIEVETVQLIEELHLKNDTADFVVKADYFPERYNELNRLERAMRFLNLARSTHYLPQKISMYVPMLECLFSSGASEATQKVSERVAFYIAEKHKRREVFDTVSAAYNIRSKYLHGDVLDNKQKSKAFLTDTSIKVDSIIRDVMVRIIMHDSANFINPDTNETGKYLKGLIFQ